MNPGSYEDKLILPYIIPGKRLKMSPILLISESENWKTITIKLHKILRNNEIKYTFERELAVFDEE